MLESLVVLGMVAGLAIYSAWTGSTASQRRGGVVLTTVVLGLIVVIAGRQHGAADADVWACLMVALCLVWQWPGHLRTGKAGGIVEANSPPLPQSDSERLPVSESPHQH